MIQFQEKTCPDRRKDGQTLFCRTRRATAAGPINIVNERLAE